MALPRLRKSVLCMAERQLALLPLPLGEGWGEGVEFSCFE